MVSTLKLNTFNCRGLGNVSKRRAIFKWLKQNHRGIVLLQETHCSERNEKDWGKEWGGKIYFSHGNTGSRGVAILFPPTFEAEIHAIKKDLEGRILILNMTTEFGPIVIANIYCPTKDYPDEQIRVLNNLNEMITEYQQNNVVIGGDFNICQNPTMDKIGGNHNHSSKATLEIENIKSDMNIIDIWRTLHPDSTRCTRRQMSKSGLVQSRLDFWLISTFMLYDVEKCDIYPGLKSDHSVVTLHFKSNETQPRGRGFFKFNTLLLKDRKYVEMIKQEIMEFTESNKNLENKGLLWDCLKC